MNKVLIKYIASLFFVMFLIKGSSQTDSNLFKVNYSSQDKSLASIFEDLENQYGLRFSFSTASILDKKKSCKFIDEDLDDALKYLLQKEQIDFKLVGNNILLRKADNYQETHDESYQKTLHLKGKIANAESKNFLEFANIYVANSNIGTYTDENGSFDLEIPFDNINDSLTVHFLGFEDQSFLIKDLKDEFLLVALNEGVFDFGEIIIVNKEKQIRFIDKEASIYLNLANELKAGLLADDISRNLHMLTGVNASDDASSEIKIRGSRADETMIVLDGIPLYNCSHFYGIFNAINSSYVNELKLYRSYFPVEFGGKTGGIVNVKSNSNIPDMNSAEAEINLLTASTKIDSRLSNKVGFSLAGRSTLRDISNTQFNNLSAAQTDEETLVQSFADSSKPLKTNPAFNFYDANAKLIWKPNDQSSISLNGFRSFDQYDNNYDRRIKNENDQSFNIEGHEIETWSNWGTSLNYKLKIGKTLVQSTAYLSQFMGEGQVDLIVRKPPRSSGEIPKPLNLSLGQENAIVDLGVKTQIAFPINNHSLAIGTELINHQINYNLNDNSESKLKGNYKPNDLSLWSQLDLQLDSLLTMKLGNRITYFEGTDRVYFSPRALIQYKVSKYFQMKSSFGFYQQFIREFPYEYRGTNRKLWVSAGFDNVPVLSATNGMIGFTILSDLVGLNIEAYRKNFKGITEYSLLQPGMGNQSDTVGPRDYSLFIGDGFTQGIDLTLSKQINKYDTYLSYTLSTTKERFKEIAMNQYFASEDDRRHQLKWINLLHFRKLSLGLDWIYSSGRPYTNIASLGSNGDIRNSSPKDRFKRVSAYSRIDISCTYQFKIRSIDSSLSFSMINLLNRENVKYVQNISEEVDQNTETLNIIVGNESGLLERTFNVAWRIVFSK